MYSGESTVHLLYIHRSTKPTVSRRSSCLPVMKKNKGVGAGLNWMKSGSSEVNDRVRTRFTPETTSVSYLVETTYIYSFLFWSPDLATPVTGIWPVDRRSKTPDDFRISLFQTSLTEDSLPVGETLTPRRWGTSWKTRKLFHKNIVLRSSQRSILCPTDQRKLKVYSELIKNIINLVCHECDFVMRNSL